METTLKDPRIGVVLEQRYRVQARIAQGGMASVYRAHDTRLDRAVAVKIMHAPYAGDPNFVRRFITEAKAAAAVNHPNIVAVYDQGTEDELTYLVMELVDGRTLRDVLTDQGRLTPGETVSVLGPVLDALAAAHRSGVMHRDIKPENVLLSSDGQVKVADFGLARAVESVRPATTKGVVMGTVAYVSPEQIMHSKSDKRSDVYAVGIMAYEMLTGEPPFTGNSSVNIAFQHVHSEVPAPADSLPGLPAEVNAVIVAATRKEPDDRPADADELLSRLRDAVEVAQLPTNAVPIPKPRSAPDMTVADSVAATTMMGAADETAVLDKVVGDAPTTVMRAVPALDDRLPARRPARSHRRSGVLSFLMTPTAMVIGVVVLALIAGLTGWWLVSPKSTVTPNLVRMTKQDAVQQADRSGLDVKFAPEEFSETVPKGLVLSQDPAADSEIDEGGTVTVVLSKGPQRTGVPDVGNQPEDAARTAMRDSGFKTKVVREYDEGIETDRVIRTEPAAGTELKPGEYVTLIVSKGKKPLEMPNVVGQPEADARRTLEGMGLTVNVTKERNASGTPGQVLSQDPDEGSDVRRGDTVTLTVAEGVKMPNVTGMSYKDAEKRLEEMGLRVRRGSGRGDDVVVAQNPAPDTALRAGDEVTLWAL